MNGIYEKSKFLHYILNTPDLSSDNLLEYANTSGLHIPNCGYIVAILRIDADKNKITDDSDMARIALIDLLCRSFTNSNHYFIPDILLNATLPVVVFENEDDGIFGVFNRLSGFKDAFYAQTGLNFAFGISSLKQNFSDVKIAYSEAQRDLKKTFELNHSESGISVTPISKMLIQDICMAVGQLNTQKAEALIDDLFKGLSENSFNNFGEAREAMLTLSAAIIIDDSIPLEIRTVLSEQYNPIEDLKLCTTVSDLRSWIIRMVRDAILLLDGMITEAHSPIVSKAIKYTMIHYDTPLTSTFIASRLFISSNHFMRVFKNEMGKTYSDYLAEYRVTLAKKFLKNNNYKIHDIGSMVGYSNSKYFNRIFKKYVGQSPSDYRRY